MHKKKTKISNIQHLYKTQKKSDKCCQLSCLLSWVSGGKIHFLPKSLTVPVGKVLLIRWKLLS